MSTCYRLRRRFGGVLAQSEKNRGPVKFQAQKVAIQCRSRFKQIRATGKDRTEMQNIFKIFIVFGIALALAACAPSLHPYFTDEDIVFDEGLLGMWVNDSGENCLFTKSGDNNYGLLFMDGGPTRFEARLIELGGATFLDL